MRVAIVLPAVSGSSICRGEIFVILIEVENRLLVAHDEINTLDQLGVVDSNLLSTFLLGDFLLTTSLVTIDFAFLIPIIIITLIVTLIVTLAIIVVVAVIVVAIMLVSAVTLTLLLLWDRRSLYIEDDTLVNQLDL